MSDISMEPGSVTGLGGKATGVGGDVHGYHTYVSSAWDDGSAAGIAGFATHGALSSYTDLFTGVVKGVGEKVKGNGTSLTSSASVVSSNDTASSSQVTSASAAIASINTYTAVSA